MLKLQWKNCSFQITIKLGILLKYLTKFGTFIKISLFYFLFNGCLLDGGKRKVLLEGLKDPKVCLK